MSEALSAAEAIRLLTNLPPDLHDAVCLYMAANPARVPVVERISHAIHQVTKLKESK